MLSIKLWHVFWAGLAAGLVSLALIGISLVPQTSVQAGLEQPAAWQDGYPPPGETQSPGETQLPDSGYPPPGVGTIQAPSPTANLTSIATSILTETPVPGLASITPSVVTTDRATASPTPTLNTTPTIVPQLSPEAGMDGDQRGFKVNWGFFWVGFAIPFLAGSGIVLYLLDRRPDLFRPRSKT
jgi:hypothetical protein